MECVHSECYSQDARPVLRKLQEWDASNPVNGPASREVCHHHSHDPDRHADRTKPGRMVSHQDGTGAEAGGTGIPWQGPALVEVPRTGHVGWVTGSSEEWRTDLEEFRRTVGRAGSGMVRYQNRDYTRRCSVLVGLRLPDGRRSCQDMKKREMKVRGFTSV